jgi:hypothetical protein
MGSQPKNLANKETTIRITLHGYGGECYMGDVPRETYEFFKMHKINIEQYAGDWGDVDWSFIPDEYQFFPPGSPFECTNLGHQTGASMEDSSSITIKDQSGNEIWHSGLDPNTLRKNGVNVDIFDEVNLKHAQNGDVIFWGGQGEKGTFFNTEISITNSFDPSKLKIYCSNLDGWILSSGVEYDGEEIEGFDVYDTTGKWGVNKFHIVGDEEVYEGKERDEDGNEFDMEDTPDGYQNSPQDWEKSSNVKKEILRKLVGIVAIIHMEPLFQLYIGMVRNGRVFQKVAQLKNVKKLIGGTDITGILLIGRTDQKNRLKLGAKSAIGLAIQTK